MSYTRECFKLTGNRSILWQRERADDIARRVRAFLQVLDHLRQPLRFRPRCAQPEFQAVVEFGEEVRGERLWGLPLIVSAARLIERPSFNRIFTRAGSIAVASIAGSEMTEVRAVSAAWLDPRICGRW